MEAKFLQRNFRYTPSIWDIIRKMISSSPALGSYNPSLVGFFVLDTLRFSESRTCPLVFGAYPLLVPRCPLEYLACRPGSSSWHFQHCKPCSRSEVGRGARPTTRRRSSRGHIAPSSSSQGTCISWFRNIDTGVPVRRVILRFSTSFERESPKSVSLTTFLVIRVFLRLMSRW